METSSISSMVKPICLATPLRLERTAPRLEESCRCEFAMAAIAVFDSETLSLVRTMDSATFSLFCFDASIIAASCAWRSCTLLSCFFSASTRAFSASSRACSFLLVMSICSWRDLAISACRASAATCA